METPVKLKTIILQEQIADVAGGKLIEGHILQQLLYWTDRARDVFKMIDEENILRKKAEEDPIKLSFEHGWIKKTADELFEEMLSTISTKAIRRALVYLEEEGLIVKRRNPVYTWDKAWQYRVCLTEINKRLLEKGRGPLSGWRFSAELQQNNNDFKGPIEGANLPHRRSESSPSKERIGTSNNRDYKQEITRKEFSNENSKTPSVEGGDSKEASDEIRKHVDRSKLQMTPVPKKPVVVSEVISSLIDFYAEVGLCKHKLGTKRYNDLVVVLKRLIGGTFFDEIKGFEAHRGIKFDPQKIRSVIKKFAKSALSPDYYPEPGSIKERLRHMSFADFVYNPRTSKSQFIIHLENDPRPLAKLPEEENKELTESIVDEYERLVKSRAKGPSIMNGNRRYIIIASNKLYQFFDENEDLISPTFIKTDDDKARYLIKAALDRVNGHFSITPEYLSSDKMFSTVLPAYLTRMAVMNAPQETERAVIHYEQMSDVSWEEIQEKKREERRRMREEGEGEREEWS